MTDINIFIEDKASPKLKVLPVKIRKRNGEKLIEIAAFIQQKALFYAYESPNAIYSKGGRLASAVRIDVNTAAGRATVRADKRVAPYANIVEVGARPHRIPNNPIWKNRIHPGMKGKFYMTRAGVDARFLAPRKIREGIGLAIRDSGFKKK